MQTNTLKCDEQMDRQTDNGEKINMSAFFCRPFQNNDVINLNMFRIFFTNNITSGVSCIFGNH